MINIDFLKNSGSFIFQKYIKKNNELEKQIKDKISKKKLQYLKMSNGLNDLVNFKLNLNNRYSIIDIKIKNSN